MENVAHLSRDSTDAGGPHAEIRRLRAENEKFLNMYAELQREMSRMFWAHIAIALVGLITVAMELYAHQFRS